MEGADPGFHPAAEKVVFGGEHFLVFPRASRERRCPDAGGEDCGFRACRGLADTLSGNRKPGRAPALCGSRCGPLWWRRTPGTAD